MKIQDVPENVLLLIYKTYCVFPLVCWCELPGHLKDALDAEQNVQALISSGDFHEIVRLYRALKNFGLKLTKHIHIDTTKIEQSVSTEAGKLIEETLKELTCVQIDSATYLDVGNLKKFGVFYSMLVEAFPGVLQQRQEFVVQASLALDTSIQQVKGLIQAQWNDSARVGITKLLVKSWGVAIELGLLDSFKDRLRTHLLAQLPAEHIHNCGESLKYFAVVSADGQVHGATAQEIIDAFPEFDRFSIEQFNSKAGGIEFKTALAQLKCDQRGPRNDAALVTAYDAYTQV